MPGDRGSGGHPSDGPVIPRGQAVFVPEDRIRRFHGGQEVAEQFLVKDRRFRNFVMLPALIIGGRHHDQRRDPLLQDHVVEQRFQQRGTFRISQQCGLVSALAVQEHQQRVLLLSRRIKRRGQIDLRPFFQFLTAGGVGFRPVRERLQRAPVFSRLQICCGHLLRLPPGSCKMKPRDRLLRLRGLVFRHRLPAARSGKCHAA